MYLDIHAIYRHAEKSTKQLYFVQCHHILSLTLKAPDNGQLYSILHCTEIDRSEELAGQCLFKVCANDSDICIYPYSSSMYQLDSYRVACETGF